MVSNQHRLWLALRLRLVAGGGSLASMMDLSWDRILPVVNHTIAKKTSRTKTPAVNHTIVKKTSRTKIPAANFTIAKKTSPTKIPAVNHTIPHKTSPNKIPVVFRTAKKKKRRKRIRQRHASTERQAATKVRVPITEGARTRRKRKVSRKHWMPLGSLDRDHFDQCVDKECLRCSLIRNGESWKKQLLIDPSSPDTGSWLSTKLLEGTWVSECLCCVKAQELNPEWNGGWWSYANAGHTMKLSCLLKHQESVAHKRAVDIYMGRSAEPMSAPTVAEFKKVFENRMTGCALQKGVNGVGHRMKVKLMQWCLSEGKRNINRKFLKTATSIALHQDVRGSKLMCRFKASNRKLQSRTGVRP